MHQLGRAGFSSAARRFHLWGKHDKEGTQDSPSWAGSARFASFSHGDMNREALHTDSLKCLRGVDCAFTPLTQCPCPCLLAPTVCSQSELAPVATQRQSWATSVLDRLL
jgi:hypothetical protein